MPDQPFKLVSSDIPGTRGNLYLIHFDDAPAPELHRFLARENGTFCSADQRAACLKGTDAKTCRQSCRRDRFYARFGAVLEEAVAESGFRPEFFRPFDNYRFPTCALEAGPLRLFGLRFDTDIFVAGDGAPKFVRRDQDDPALDRALKDVEYVARRLRVLMDRRGHRHPPRDARGLLHLPEDLRVFP